MQGKVQQSTGKSQQKTRRPDKMQADGFQLPGGSHAVEACDLFIHVAQATGDGATDTDEEMGDRKSVV
jgi:hypothetical protein